MTRKSSIYGREISIVCNAVCVDSVTISIGNILVQSSAAQPIYGKMFSIVGILTWKKCTTIVIWKIVCRRNVIRKCVTGSKRLGNTGLNNRRVSLRETFTQTFFIRDDCVAGMLLNSKCDWIIEIEEKVKKHRFKLSTINYDRRKFIYLFVQERPGSKRR